MLSRPPSARPRIFRRPSLLIVGCGDVGLRVVALLGQRFRIHALTSSPQRRTELRRAGVHPLVGNLDESRSLARLSGLAQAVLHLAPPPSSGLKDARTRHLLNTLAKSDRVKRLVYGSTTGVYGDCQGALFDETRAAAPRTDRAHRRVDAERQVRTYGRQGRNASILRIPGIYADDRDGGPRQRLLRGTPVLEAADDVYTNHIHAHDLARACVRALLHGRPQRVTHVCDDTDMKMGDYFDWAADLFGLPRPHRISRVEAQAQMSPMTLSFLGESRRLRNDRLKRELRLRLVYPTLADSLRRKD